MTTLDFSPLFRTAIGFDRLARLVDTANAASDTQAYPPYNIEKTGEESAIASSMAVAGLPRRRTSSSRWSVTTRSFDLRPRAAPRASQGRAAVPRHRRPRLRAPLRACRPHRGRGRGRRRTACCLVGLKRVVPEALKPRRDPRSAPRRRRQAIAQRRDRQRRPGGLIVSATRLDGNEAGRASRPLFRAPVNDGRLSVGPSSRSWAVRTPRRPRCLWPCLRPMSASTRRDLRPAARRM